MTTVSATTIRDRVGDLILQTFGTGPFGALTPTASGGVVTFPAGYQVVFAEAGLWPDQAARDALPSPGEVLEALLAVNTDTSLNALKARISAAKVAGRAL